VENSVAFWKEAFLISGKEIRWKGFVLENQKLWQSLKLKGVVARIRVKIKFETSVLCITYRTTILKKMGHPLFSSVSLNYQAFLKFAI
jgi:hypothetical protein